ncbi:MAG: CvpA family protein [Lachnospiraceae bacterium]|nr:CvpA family protein [Lachnospiraceae bacterium]
MNKKAKKIIGYIVAAIIVFMVAFAYYYITLPAINIHSKGFWGFIIFMMIVLNICWLIKKMKKGKGFLEFTTKGIDLDISLIKEIKIGLIATGVVILVFIVGSLASTTFFNAKKYQQLLTVETRNFVEDIKEVDYTQIPILDKASATLLGDKKMGSMVGMVSQFEVADNYTQINFNGKPVRVTPLEYASIIKWFSNHSEGIPAYMLIDMTNQETECVQLEEPIKYSESEFFGRYIYRHLRFQYPTYIFDDQIFFEVDDEGTPFWICPVVKYNIGLFGGKTIGRVVICNAQTGDCVDYAVEDVPTWVDKVYSAELLLELYDYHGTLVNGFWNSVLSQKDCLQSTNGYNYIAMEDDVWVYTGVTSVASDQSNVGFVLMNQRTMETRFYIVEGSIEDAAMSSAEGQVQNLGYQATFPLLLNISDEPTYFMALKDGAGLVKKYAMVNIQKYQWVAIGDTVKECEKNYITLLSTNGISDAATGEEAVITGNITAMASVVIDGNSHYYLIIDDEDVLYDVNLSNDALAMIIKYAVGDKITLKYSDVDGIKEVVSFE